MASKGNANRVTLGERMKEFEEVTTSQTLVKRLPIYARLDMRAGHSFCADLERPFDKVYSETMEYVAGYLLEKTGAKLAYTQSDEISLVWLDHRAVPFENRVFKMESVFAGMASAAFAVKAMNGKMCAKVALDPPSFDCRVCNLPTVGDAVDMIRWRERDCLKNAVTLAALSVFKTNEIDKKNSEDKIKMLAERGFDFETQIQARYRRGVFLRRREKILTVTEAELREKGIPERHWPQPDLFGTRMVTRTVTESFLPSDIIDRLTRDCAAKELFG